MASANTLTFTDSNFEEEVLQADTPVLVDFWAEWCGPCQKLGPTIEALAEEYVGRVKVGKIDTDKNPHVAATYGIMSIPTVMIFQNGEMKEKLIGLKGKTDYASILDALAG